MEVVEHWGDEHAMPPGRGQAMLTTSEGFYRWPLAWPVERVMESRA